MISPASASPRQFQRTQELSVGVPEIDSDHRHFITLANDLTDAIAQHRELSMIEWYMQTIIEDAEEHFAHEQELFKVLGRPDAATHRKHHIQTMVALRDTMTKLSTDTTDYERIEDGLQFKHLLVAHLLAECEGYRRWLRTTLAYA